jgi:hypothetical protein
MHTTESITLHTKILHFNLIAPCNMRYFHHKLLFKNSLSPKTALTDLFKTAVYAFCHQFIIRTLANRTFLVPTAVHLQHNRVCV